MRIPSLERSPPSVLVLGPRGEGLARLLRALGVVVDFASARESALTRFAERGGHDLVLVFTEHEYEEAAGLLTAIDPALRVVRVEPEERLDDWLAAVLR